MKGEAIGEYRMKRKQTREEHRASSKSENICIVQLPRMGNKIKQAHWRGGYIEVEVGSSRQRMRAKGRQFVGAE
jgi:hypothetical protein